MPSKQDYEEFFTDADKDGSGSLSFDELVTTLKNKGYKGTDNDLKKFFNSTDTSGDNMISKDEYMVAMGQQEPTIHNGAAMRRCFREFDKDNSGSIDAAELKQVFKELGKSFSESEIQRMISMMDADASGTVNYEEFIQHVFGK